MKRRLVKWQPDQYWIQDIRFHGGVSYPNVLADVKRPDLYPRGALVIGFFGSAGMGYDLQQKDDKVLRGYARDIGREIASLGKTYGERRAVLVTGACKHLPHEAARGAYENGGFVVGITAADSLETHQQIVHDQTTLNEQELFYNMILHPQFNFGDGQRKVTPDVIKNALKWRNGLNSEMCDAVTGMDGNYGTLYELAASLHPDWSIVGLFSLKKIGSNKELAKLSLMDGSLSLEDYIFAIGRNIGRHKNKHSVLIHDSSPRSLVRRIYRACIRREEKIGKRNANGKFSSYHPSMENYMEKLVVDKIEDSMIRWDKKRVCIEKSGKKIKHMNN